MLDFTRFFVTVCKEWGALEERREMRKKFVIFYSDNEIIKSIGIWQKMSNNGKRAMIEYIDYLDMLYACMLNRELETRYKNRVVENCVWMDVEELYKSNHGFLELREEHLLKNAFIKSEQLRDIARVKGYGVLNYDRRRT